MEYAANDRRLGRFVTLYVATRRHDPERIAVSRALKTEPFRPVTCGAGVTLRLLLLQRATRHSTLHRPCQISQELRERRDQLH
jgi:hypothetical protein